jgi:hypothetical protein
MRTGGEGAEQVNFGKEFEVVAPLSGTRFDEILMPIWGQARDLKDVEHIVDIAFV